MMAYIFKEMKNIRDRGGIHLTLEFDTNQKHDVILLPDIQFIIGDRTYNDIIYGKKRNIISV